MARTVRLPCRPTPIETGCDGLIVYRIKLTLDCFVHLLNKFLSF